MSHKMTTEVRLPFALGSHERLFLGVGDSHKEEVTILMRFDRVNPYGWRLLSKIYIFNYLFLCCFSKLLLVPRRKAETMMAEGEKKRD